MPSLASRRDFIQHAAAVPAALVWPTLVRGQSLGSSPIAGTKSGPIATKERSTDLVIIGGGLGGCAAALAAARRGQRVILTEETDWIGGQLTSQAVPPDENPLVETTGSTRSYRELRQRIRGYYSRNFALSEKARVHPAFNPGNGGVSKLCHEPRVALAALEELMAPFVATRQIEILRRHQATAANSDRDRVTAVQVRSLESGREIILRAPLFVDATETGELLPLTKTEYVSGTEARRDTGEPHAPVVADPQNHQAFTCCFAVDYLANEDHVIDRSTFAPGTDAGDVPLVTWPLNDYMLGNLFDVPPEEAARHLARAKELSLSWLYWLQTECPRSDGGTGWPGLRLRPDIVGTADGLAKCPYIRESRRIRADFTVTELHVGTEARMQSTGASSDLVTAAPFFDSVGIGSYNIDLHPSSRGDNYIDFLARPFQIPLGALIPQRIENLLPACKNIGTTHLTNGCYRLHPVEWNIGEAVGALAAFCTSRQRLPREIRKTPALLAEFQASLSGDGVPLAWEKK